MARGWGRSEEDQPGDKEDARLGRETPYAPPPEELERLRKRRSIEMSLAHIEAQLARTHASPRREALESAREDLRQRLTNL